MMNANTTMTFDIHDSLTYRRLWNEQRQTAMRTHHTRGDDHASDLQSVDDCDAFVGHHDMGFDS
jgi:hypothetical protein